MARVPSAFAESTPLPQCPSFGGLSACTVSTLVLGPTAVGSVVTSVPPRRPVYASLVPQSPISRERAGRHVFGESSWRSSMSKRVTTAPSIDNVSETSGFVGSAPPSGDPKSAWCRGVCSSRGVMSSRPLGPLRLRAESEPRRAEEEPPLTPRLRGDIDGRRVDIARGEDICPLAAWMRGEPIGEYIIVGAAATDILAGGRANANSGWLRAHRGLAKCAQRNSVPRARVT